MPKLCILLDTDKPKETEGVYQALWHTVED
jgi:hypothetical protein